MSRKYKVLLPLLVNGEHGQGDEFEHEFTPEDEHVNVASGLLEVVPSEYRVVAEDSIVYDTPTGETFTAGLLMENEAALIAGGHIERVEEKKPAPKRKAKEANK
jgi:hypothetical protein